MSTFQKYNIKTVTKFSMGDFDFDRLCRDHLPLLTDTGDRYKIFECVAEFQWLNDSNYDTIISIGDLKNDIYDSDKKDILKGERYLGLHQIMCFLADYKVIPFGHYEIRVSYWERYDKQSI